MVAGFTIRSLQIGEKFHWFINIMLCCGNCWNFFMLSNISSSAICFKKSWLRGDLRTLTKETPWNLCIHYITWLMKTHKSTTKCSFVEIVVFRLTVPHSLLGSSYDIGSKRTNHKFGCFSEVRQSNIRTPSKIPLIWKCIFLIFFPKSRGGGPCPQPLPLRGPWYDNSPLLTSAEFWWVCLCV